MKSERASIASLVNDQMKMVRELAPSLVCLRAALIPFSDIIVEEFAGPQPAAEDYDPDEEPYFSVGVTCGQFAECHVVFTFTADRVTVEEWATKASKWREMVPTSGPTEITLAGVFNYLRQLPRPVDSFRD